ncbi:MAG: Asp-tRNA(Asn)/Glu-tRNA(Gln) amidotransferase subunit GatB [Acidimicrobiaceae bacterium]|nr:Asp-tRNA(Asn)/Glu-tRNA(Gln) amidotransferase subunit GatB [Acidimicrobiaceae bacterium]MYC41512.1 Asp-tRNA(Asn)/Glu-tRNA(Gln) amidotransferase subunit GatB [Acidimicrobiaceae bacterium]MYH88768.1 Asp-tRNA(Asn)/Glu-tRNA(Gln) amidotransferase subunit GatB [Acidimicrobiaceae bacterium]
MSELAPAATPETPVESALPEGWELIVGLEVHVELDTATKLFCGCVNRFGVDPNTNVCPTCLGLPGSLPVMNERAVEMAMILGRALGCQVNRSVMARKNYFYPDMPKDFQTTQYDQPTNSEGELKLADGFVVRIERAHIEEDTGKSVHVGGGGRINEAVYSLVDYNRAGVPLIEIVSKPDIRTIEHARNYVEELRAIVVATGVSDARMEEGSIRVDANVSVRRFGSSELRTRCEIKNINSLRSLGRAIEHEALRQIDLWTTGSGPQQQTRHWDEDAGRTTPGRSKEDVEDYRYFQEPDLVPLDPTSATIAAIDAAMPPLPSARRSALRAATGAGIDAARLLVERGQDGLAMAAVAAGADGAKTVTRLVNDLAVNDWSKVEAESFAALVRMESNGELSASQAKQVLGDLVERGGDPAAHAAVRGFEAMDTTELESLLDQLIGENPEEWSRYCGGDEGDRKKMQGFFTGQIMKATRGQADGKVVAQLLAKRSSS